MQGTWVRSLLQEDSTCLRATEPRAAATWPALQSPCSSTGEATTVRSLHPTARGQPLLPAARESPHAATNAQHSPKWIRSKKKNISVHEVLGRNWTCKQNTRCSGWQRSREKNRMCPPSPQHTQHASYQWTAQREGIYMNTGHAYQGYSVPGVYVIPMCTHTPKN